LILFIQYIYIYKEKKNPLGLNLFDYDTKHF
jgi:hypothetical protein